MNMIHPQQIESPIRIAGRWSRRLGVLALLASIVLSGAAANEARAQSLGTTGQQQQQQVTVRPPDPGDPEAPSRLMVYAVALLLGGAAIGLAVMPSRRTHED